MAAGSLTFLALAATILTCAVVDGCLLALTIWLSGEIGKGVVLFLVAGGPVTLAFAWPLHSWFKARIAEYAAF